MKNHPGKKFSRVVAMVALISFGWALGSYAGGKVAAWGANDYRQTTFPSGLNNIKAVAAGGNHSLALRADGTVVGWGWNAYGQATPPLDLNNVVSIAAGGQVSLAIRANGTVAAWGLGSLGQLDVPEDLSRVIAVATGGAHCLALKADGTVTVWGGFTNQYAYSNTNIPSGLSHVSAIAAGSYHSLVLSAHGTVSSWGWSGNGQTDVPAGLSNVVAIAAGHYHNLALKSDGTVAAWGDGFYGQTNVPSGLSNVIAITAGYYANLALRADGTLVSWGYGPMTNLPPSISNVTAIACGGYHNLAIVSDGPPEILEQSANLAVAFQSNTVLSVVARGFEPLSYRWFVNGSPVANSARISGVTNASLSISNAQFSDTGIYTVIVSNAFGSVQSSGALLTVISPPIITLHPVGRTVIAGTNVTLTGTAIGTPPLSYRWLRDGTPLAGATGTSLTLSNVQSSQSGNYSLLVSNVYGVTESSNALVTILESPPYILNQPSNRSGFLGGTATFTVNGRGSTPLSYQWRFNGVDISGATNAALTLTSLRYDQEGLYSVAISNAFGSVVSAKAQLLVNQVAVWGGGSLGGALTNVPGGLTNLLAIAAGENHLLALESDGTVAAWGGSRPYSPPGSANPTTNVPAGLNGVITIAAGSFHNLALRSNGAVVAWGDTTFGHTNVPADLSNVISVAAGEAHSLALKEDGRVVAWGGRSTLLPTSPYAALTNVPPGLSNVVAIAAGFDRSLALKSDGRVVAWGLPGSVNVPPDLSNVIAIACGEVIAAVRPRPGSSSTFNLALKADGTVVSWIAGTDSQPPPYPWILTPSPPPGLSNVVGIAAGGHGMALKADGSVVLWGLTNPPPPQGLSNVIGIAAGYGFAAAMAGDGSPFFTIQPVGQTVARGSRVQFHARATGVQPLRYQWQLDGVNLPGATNASLMLTNVQGRDVGGYQLVVSNALGSAASAIATLTIPFSTNLAAALNATNLTWTTSPTNSPWFAEIRETHDGDAAAQSGRIGHNQESTLHATVSGPGTLSFWWKVSSEEAYDRLWFSMDYLNWATWISGETDWGQFTYHVPAGSHVLRWAYTKDSTVSTGQDAGWLDQVVFTPASPQMLASPFILPDGSLAFTASDIGGRSLLPYNLAFIEIQASTNLRDWTTLVNACTLTNGSLLIRDPDRAHYPHRFYRIVEH